ncbi:MAG: ASKHA domain-containing protein [Oscillospiraceae bacterium]
MRIWVEQAGVEKPAEIAQQGGSLLQALIRLGYFVDAPCAGNGRCGKCRVWVRGAEETNWREALACRAHPSDGLRVRLPGECEMIPQFQGLSVENIAASPERAGYALAVDIGTTTVAVYLAGPPAGTVLRTAGGVNRQRPFGADVISRIQACIEEPAALERLRNAVSGQINRWIQALCAKQGVRREEVAQISVVGNTTMLCLFAGIDPSPMGTAPFSPPTLFGRTENAASLGLALQPDTPVFLSPCISAFVGGDISAGMLACGLFDREGVTLYVDVGTNGEMAIGSREGAVCCSVAAGPAFEGAHISCGMGGVPGAVCRADWSEQGLRTEVIGGLPAAGVCGSGLIDAVAVMLAAGALDETGRLLDAEEAPLAVRPYLFQANGENAFRLAENVWITARDIREVQLAKAAVCAGILTLLHRTGRTAADVDRLCLAGGFGAHLRAQSAAAIGLIPPALLSKVEVVGNAAGIGALALLHQENQKRLVQLAADTACLELSVDAYFKDAYMEEMLFSG